MKLLDAMGVGEFSLIAFIEWAQTIKCAEVVVDREDWFLLQLGVPSFSDHQFKTSPEWCNARIQVGLNDYLVVMTPNVPVEREGTLDLRNNGD